jgi:hypothetical protein
MRRVAPFRLSPDLLSRQRTCALAYFAPPRQAACHHSGDAF